VGPLPPLSWLVPPQNGALTQLEPPLAKSTYDVKTEEGNEYTIRDAADPHLDGWQVRSTFAFSPTISIPKMPVGGKTGCR
jgi:hypothetical protein